MSNPNESSNFANQDFRNRSFHRQMLNGANFSGADLRGCNFRGAQLVGANFERAKLGQSLRQQMIWISSAIATFLIAGHAVSNLVFGSLGQTPADKAWNYVLVLVGVSGLAGALGAVRSGLKPPFHRVAEILAGVAAGAVVGFFYAGVMTEKDPRWAIAGAMLGGVGLGAFRLIWRVSLTAIVLQMAVTITTYGFAFLIGATALGMLNVGYVMPGVLLGSVAYLYLWFTWQGLVDTLQTLRQSAGTSFRNANLTDAKFSGISLQQADFSGAVGIFFEEKPDFRGGV